MDGRAEGDEGSVWWTDATLRWVIIVIEYAIVLSLLVVA